MLSCPSCRTSPSTSRACGRAFWAGCSAGPRSSARSSCAPSTRRCPRSRAERTATCNAYSDEILHAARLSPLTWTSRLSREEIARLLEATKKTLAEWTDRLRREAGDGFPENVTAFRDGMAVHGRFGKPCPECGAAV